MTTAGWVGGMPAGREVVVVAMVGVGSGFGMGKSFVVGQWTMVVVMPSFMKA